MKNKMSEDSGTRTLKSTFLPRNQRGQFMQGNRKKKNRIHKGFQVSPTMAGIRNSANSKKEDSKILKSLRFTNPGKKVAEFANFKPEESEREKRKLRRLQEEEHLRHLQNRTVYDKDGRLTSNGQDLCDCLDKSCVGCHYPCKDCKSTMCGPVCRCKRKWVFELVEDEEQNYVVKF